MIAAAGPAHCRRIEPLPPLPTPAPPELKPIRVLVVEETAERTQALAALIASPKIAEWLRQRNAQHRWADQHTLDAEAITPAHLKHYIQHAAQQGLPWCYLFDARGNAVWQGRPPQTPDQLLALLEATEKTRWTQRPRRPWTSQPHPSTTRQTPQRPATRWVPDPDATRPKPTPPGSPPCARCLNLTFGAK